MRYVVVVVLVLAGSIATADPLPESATRWRQPNDSGTFLEVGAGWMRAEPDGRTYRAQY